MPNKNVTYLKILPKIKHLQSAEISEIIEMVSKLSKLLQILEKMSQSKNFYAKIE